MKNNITIIGINFYPEDSSTGLYNTQMAEYLSKYYNINVITGFPYYPEWKIKENYKSKNKFLQEKRENINIYRYKQYVPKSPTFKHRIIHLIDWTLGSIINVFKIKKTDLVICIVPFTSSAILGLLLSKLKGAKVWIHVQDFEFDAAIESGLISKKGGIKKKIFNTLFLLEKKLFNKSNIISTISYSMLKKLKTKTKVESYYFPNWINVSFFENNIYRHQYMMNNKFKILYSGNIGEKQDWEFFIKVVEYFQKYNNIEFIVVGAGAKKEWLVNKTQKFVNIKHYMPIEYKELPNLLCSANLHVLFQKPDVIDTVMPSKLLGMMASAVPSIITGNIKSEVAQIFKESQSGYFFNSKDLNNVINTILFLLENPEKAKKIGMNAKQYVIKNFSSDKVLTQFKLKIDEVIKGL